MFSRFKRLSLVYQLSAAVVVITLSVFTGLTLHVSRQTAEDALNAVEIELGREVGLIATQLEFFHDTLVHQTDQLSDVFFGMFSQGRFEVDAQALIQVGDSRVPSLRYQGEVINTDFTKPDAFTAMTGGTATIFLRHGDDFLRVSTSLPRQDGSRAFGTRLGHEHPGYGPLMRGDSYSGPAELFGHRYMTKYVPVKDASGEVVGVLYVGFDYTKQFQALKRRLSGLRFGDTGYLFAVDAKPGPAQGRLVMHPSLEGKNIFEISDAAGNPMLRRPLDATAGILHYRWRNESGSVEDKTVAYKLVRGWNWIVAAGSFTSEFTRAATALRNGLIVVSLISAVLIMALTFWALRRQLRPLGRIGHQMELLGRGDLSSDVDLAGIGQNDDTGNEVQILACQVRRMTDSFRELITGVNSSVRSLSGAAQQVAQVAARTNDGVKSQQSETDQVATAINELTTTVQGVALNAVSAADETKQADLKATQGGDVVRNVAASIEALASELEQSADVIGRLERESENIGSVLEVIRSVAEQTNLLALNAAIEAARAGEQGRGFAVVADEVRNLARKTQASTTEISDMIQRLQHSSAEVVSAMGVGRSKARDSVSRANQAGEDLVEIARSTSAIAGVTIEIARAAEQETAVAEEINQSVARIRDIANTTAEGADAMGVATDALQTVARGLHAAVDRFKL